MLLGERESMSVRGKGPVHQEPFRIVNRMNLRLLASGWIKRRKNNVIPDPQMCQSSKAGRAALRE